MARTRGAKDLAPRKNAKTPEPRKSTAQARAQAQADSHRSNGIPIDALKKAVADIERQHEILATYQGEHMSRCKGPREKIKEAQATAKSSGVPLRALNAEIKRRDLERRTIAVRAKLEPDDQSLLDQIREALGGIADLPLGKAAVTAAERGARAIGSIAGASQAEANAAALEAGISKLQ